MEKFLENINLSSFDPKSKLQEWSLKNKKKLPTYEIMNRSGPDHSPTFTIKVILDEKFSSFAKGKSKQDAEIKAANKLLKKFVNKKCGKILLSGFSNAGKSSLINFFKKKFLLFLIKFKQRIKK